MTKNVCCELMLHRWLGNLWKIYIYAGHEIGIYQESDRR